MNRQVNNTDKNRRAYIRKQAETYTEIQINKQKQKRNTITRTQTHVRRHMNAKRQKDMH